MCTQFTWVDPEERGGWVLVSLGGTFTQFWAVSKCCPISPGSAAGPVSPHSGRSWGCPSLSSGPPQWV